MQSLARGFELLGKTVLVLGGAARDGRQLHEAAPRSYGHNLADVLVAAQQVAPTQTTANPYEQLAKAMFEVLTMFGEQGRYWHLGELTRDERSPRVDLPAKWWDRVAFPYVQALQLDPGDPASFTTLRRMQVRALQWEFRWLAQTTCELLTELFPDHAPLFRPLVTAADITDEQLETPVPLTEVCACRARSGVSVWKETPGPAPASAFDL